MTDDLKRREKAARELWDEQVYEDDPRAVPGHDIPLIFFSAMIVIALALLVLFWPIGGAKADHSAVHSWLQSWIPSHCCVNNRCCFAITAADVRPLSGDRWEVLATGQVVKRTNWSPDGGYWRCACDLVGTDWAVHDKANTRCLFVPLPNS